MLNLKSNSNFNTNLFLLYCNNAKAFVPKFPTYKIERPNCHSAKLKVQGLICQLIVFWCCLILRQSNIKWIVLNTYYFVMDCFKSNIILKLKMRQTISFWYSPYHRPFQQKVSKLSPWELFRDCDSNQMHGPIKWGHFTLISTTQLLTIITHSKSSLSKCSWSSKQVHVRSRCSKSIEGLWSSTRGVGDINRSFLSFIISWK